MNRELYTAASGLILENNRLELATNNLANVQSDGFRAQRGFVEAYRTARSGAPPSAVLAGTYDEAGPGPLRPTGRPLDLALLDDALLAVQTPQGIRYTRAGSLQIDATGRLVDRGGRAVLGQKGQTIEPLTEEATLAGDATVHDGRATLGQLRLVRDPLGLLRREGDGLFTAAGQDEQLESLDDPHVKPGWLEGSAANPVGELVQLIETQRSFERYQRLVSLTMNEVNRRAAEDIAGN